MTNDEMIEVIQANKDGKKIEFRRHVRIIGYNSVSSEPWNLIGLPTWDFTNYDYRVKPEKKKRLITVKEMFNDGVMAGGLEDKYTIVFSKFDLFLEGDALRYNYGNTTKWKTLKEFIDAHEIEAWYDREGNRRSFYVEERGGIDEM